MKVSVKSVLKSSDRGFQCFQDQRIIVRAGNMLCMREIERGEGLFIPLHKHIHHLYCYKVANNRKSIYVVEKHEDDLQLCQYALTGERKSFSLIAESIFFSDVETLELLVDEYDSSLVYGAAKGKETACVFLVDMNKLKLMAIGFLPVFADFKIDGRQNMTVSVCGSSPHNYIKSLRYGMNQWQVYEQAYKRVQDPVIQHEIIYGGRQLLITASEVFVFQEHDLVQAISFADMKARIAEVVRLSKGLVVRFWDDSLRLLLEDSDETTFLQAGQLTLQLLPGEHIAKLAISLNFEEIVLKSTTHNYYVWRCQHVSTTTDRSELIFNRVYNNCCYSQQGSISISTGKKYCLLTGVTNATLWSIEKNQVVLSCDFAQQGRKVLLAGAINPDGNSILVAFEDKVRLYRILLTKFKQVCEFNIKRCQNIVFSHGGQLAACRFGKGNNACVTILNMVRLVQIGTLKLQNQPRQLVWNELDEELVVSTESNTIQVYRISDANKIYNVKLPQEITQVRIDYKTKQIIASCLNQIFIVQEGTIVEQFSPPVDNFHYMFPLYGAYFAATRSGELLWSYSPKFETYHQMPLFSNQPFSMVCRNGYLLAYTSFQDVTVLRCERPSPPMKKSSGEDIVMVQRDEVLAMFQKVRVIESSYQILTTATQAKLQEEKQKYQAAIQHHRQTFKDEISFLNAKLAELANEKLHQQKQNEKIFGMLQDGQVRNITDLQRMYDRKFDIEKEKLLNLQQAFLEQRIKYEKLVLDIEAKYHRDVQQVRQEYASKTKEEAMRIESLKSVSLQQKAGMEMRLIDLEQENELALCDLQLASDASLEQLRIRHTKLEEQYEQAMIRIHSQQTQIQSLEQEARTRRVEAETLQARVSAYEGRVNLLERELVRKDEAINNKNQVIQEQAHQIGGLEKAKYVLSFRTTEIRKQLQPKEQQVDKLKAQMFKMQEEFKQEKKRNNQLLSRIQKLQRINQIGKREVSDLRIALKHRQRTHDDLCSQIFTLVNNTDAKDWNAQIVRLYQTYIREDRHDNRGKQSDDTSQQLTRHLRHVEESLMQVTSGAEKVLKGKEKEVMRKMKENSELVYQLNVMRKKENDFSRERRDLNNQNARLKRELNETMRTTTRSQTATGFTRRIVSRDSKERSLVLDIHDLGKSKGEIKSGRVERNRLVTARRTLLVTDEKKQKQSKIFDVARELQSARSTIKRQDRMIQELNHRIHSTLDQ